MHISYKPKLKQLWFHFVRHLLKALRFDYLLKNQLASSICYNLLYIVCHLHLSRSFETKLSLRGDTKDLESKLEILMKYSLEV